MFGWVSLRGQRCLELNLGALDEHRIRSDVVAGSTRHLTVPLAFSVPFVACLLARRGGILLCGR